VKHWYPTATLHGVTTQKTFTSITKKCEEDSAMGEINSYKLQSENLTGKGILRNNDTDGTTILKKILKK
jgi:hypothetical protein